MTKTISLIILSFFCFASYSQAPINEALSLKPVKVNEASNLNIVYTDADKLFALPADGAFLYSSLIGESGVMSSGYNNNEDHIVTINNQYDRKIFLKSNYFFCESNDKLMIYDGKDTAAPLIKVISGILDDNFLILSTGKSLTLRFISDNAGTSKGFRFRLDNGPAAGPNPAPSLPTPMACASTPAADECNTAPLICNLNGYCGNTSGSYTAGNTSGLGNFCGSIENNSWLSFVASGTSASLAFNSGGCQDNSAGIQAVIYASSNCTSFTEVSNCESQSSGAGSFTITTNVNLVPGQTYYVMVDGFAGNVCSYTVSAQAGVALGQQINGPTQVCPGSSVNLSSSSTASSYTWTSTPPGTYPNTQTITVTPAVTTTYTLTLGASVCAPAGTTVVKTVTVTNTLNPANITAPSLVCYGSNVSLVSLTNGGTYVWTGPAGFTSNVQSPTINNWTTANNGNYSLTINYGGGCATTPTVVNVSGVAAPIVNIAVAPSLTICAGQSLTLTASGGTGANPYNWNWNLLQTSIVLQSCVNVPFIGLQCTNNPLFSLFPGVSSTGPLAVVTPNQSTQVCTSFENSVGCIGSKCVDIVVLPAAPALTISPTATICPGQSTTLSISGGTTYTWSPAASLSSTNGATVSANPLVTTVYTASTTACGGTIITKTVQVVVNGTPPAIGAISGQSVICANTSGVTYSVNSVASTNYTWSVPGGASITSTPTNSNAITVNFGSTAGTISVTAVGTCGTATASINVGLSPALNLTVTPSNASICTGGSVALTASGATNYTWSPSASLSSANGSNVTATPVSSTTYTVIGATGTCTGSATAIVTMGSALTLTLTSNTPTVCPGASALLDANGATNYTWSPSATLNTSTGSNVTAPPLSNTIYTVTGSTGGCMGVATISVGIGNCVSTGCNLAAIRTALTNAGNVELLGMTNTCSLYFINPQYMNGPQAQAYAQTFGASLISVQSAAENADLVQALSNQGYSSNVVWIGFSDAISEGNYIWYDGAPISYTNWAPNEPNNAGGNENCTQIYPDGTWNDLDCGGYNSMSVIEVNLCPQVTVSNVPVHCPNTNVTLTASTLLGSPSYTYTWLQSGTETFTNTSTPGNTDNISVTSTAANTFTVYSEDRYSCPQSAIVNLSVFATPSITVNNATICLGQQTATLTASGAVSYTWSPSATLSSANGNSVTATPALTTNYSITGTDANNCVATNTTIVNVVTIPTLTISPTVTICPGSSTQLTINGSTNYTWSPAGTLSSANGNSVTATPTATTIYSVTSTNGNGCISTSSVQVTVSTTPTITISPSATICPSANTTLIAGGAVSYTWSPAASLNVSNGATVTATPTINTTYSVVGANSDGCTNTNSVTINVTSNPTLTVSANVTLCPAGTATLMAGGATNYTWSPSASLNVSNSATVISTPTVTTLYTITGDNAFGCISTYTLSVTVANNPTVSVTANSTICPGASKNLTATGANTYSWLPATTLSSSTGSIVVASPSTTETYTVIGTIGTCTNAAQVAVTVTTNPIVTIAPINPICSGSNVTLTASGAVTYTWVPPSNLNTNTGNSVIANPPVTTNYTVTGASALNCKSTATIAVIVIPTPTITTTAASLIICEGKNTILNAFGSATNSYTWSASPAGTISNANTSPTTVSPILTTTYTVIGTNGTAPNLCTSSNTIVISVIPKTVATTYSVDAICFGSYTTLVATGGNKYSWLPTTGVYSPNDSVTIVKPAITTVYTVTVSKNGICPNTNTVVVVVNPLPTVYAGKDSIINIDEEITLIGTGNVEVGFLPPTAEPLICNFCAAVTVAPDENTCYVLSGTNSFGCTNTDTICVIVTKEWNVYIPNAFTPNGDDANDVFIPVGFGLSEIRLTIFDRWGSVIFKSHGETIGWDGSSKGKLCEQGVYVYQADIVTMAGTTVKRTGHVTVLPKIR